MKPLLILVFIGIGISGWAQSISQALNSGWQFSEATKNDWKPATVPGTIHTDLLANNLIPDPYLEDNEKKVQWVEEKTWEYKTTFDCDKFLWKQKNKELDFEGLDTYADVYLNDSLLFTADDMFLSYTKDVSKLLKKKNNTLRIVFHPVSELITRSKDLSSVKDLPGGDRVYARKAQYQFGWDWGPRLVTCGIWKNVKLVGYTNTFIRDAQFHTVWISGDSAWIKYSITLGGKSTTGFDLLISTDSTLLTDEKIVLDQRAAQPVIEGHFVIHHPKLWWCNGLGDPNLYKLTVSLKTKRISQSRDFSFGVRTIVLQQTDPATGKNDFRFILNDVDVFAKGANWIPCDNFIPRVTHQKYYNLISEAKNENMNMLRVWGGGIYEQDDFYNLCDSLGIMVWQDFMFACGMYPGSLAFLNQVKNEAYDNLLRLENHPCISVWCGNNEDYEGWLNWDWQKDRKDADIKEIESDYSAVFNNANGILVSAVNEVYSKWFPYISTSPQIGWGHQESLTKGDSHYWGVWWGEEPFSSYDTHVGRFVSEYGFQSLPSINTFRKMGVQNFQLTDSIVQLHQKNGKGFQTISDYMNRDYPSPKTFEDYAYLSQVVQYDGVKRAIDDHRSAVPRCMGTLFWQFDDCWPVTSWSAIDYFGEKKILSYKLPMLYAASRPVISFSHDSVKVSMVNNDTSLAEGTITLYWMKLNGTLLHMDSVTYQTAGNEAELLKVYTPDFVSQLNSDSVFLFFFDSNRTEPEYFFISNDKNLALSKDPGLHWYLHYHDHEPYLIFESKSLAKDVFITSSSPQLELEQHYFNVLPNFGYAVKINTSMTEDQIRGALNIQMINSLK